MTQEQSMRILIIEDDGIERAAIARHFNEESLPYDLVFAKSASEAEKRLGEGGYRLILASYGLRDTPGIDAARSRGNVACVLLTRASEAEDALSELKGSSSRVLLRDTAREYVKLLPLAIEATIKQEEALKESETRLRLVSETIEDVFWITDWLSHRTTFVSAAYEKVWGRSAQSLYDNPTDWADAIHPADRKRAWERFVKMGEGDSYDEEYRIVRPDGSERLIRDRGYPVRGSDGSIFCAVGIAQDVTERRRAQKEQQRLERQLQQTQKLESLGVLAGGIAHDFNNLLMAILGNADIALNRLSPHAPARSNVEEIVKASYRAAELARQMLAYSGRGKFVVEPIRINEFVSEMSHLLEVGISKKIILKYDFADDLPTFEGDATQIRQVIMNLITNASEAIGDKSGAIAISTGSMQCDRAYLDSTDLSTRLGLESPLPEGTYTCLEVSDTGCGMDKETREKIFDPFFTTKFTGRGLGMAALLGIVRGHNGTLKIYSEVGKGTTFKVLFPVVEGIVEKPEREEVCGASSEYFRRGGTVLVADDEEKVRDICRQMLERAGFSVITACDGREALERYREHTDEIVCVILDLTMPRLDGEQTFRELRRVRSDVRVVLSSGYNEQEVTQRFVGKGLAGFIQKPYVFKTLIEKLKQVLGS